MKYKLFLFFVVFGLGLQTAVRAQAGEVWVSLQTLSEFPEGRTYSLALKKVSCNIDTDRPEAPSIVKVKVYNRVDPTPLPFWLVLRGFDPWNPCRPKL